MNPIPTCQSNFSYTVMLSKASNTYTSNMNNSWTSDIQLSIQQSLQEIASQMGQPLDEVAAERLYRDSSILLDRIPCEPLTLARVAGTLLVYQMQKTEPEEVDWFKSQVQQCSTDEEIEELIESIHRTDAL